ncbi:MAG: hypothetical protein A4E49_02026 [Methanosaeta sp. PtaU1.Bin112]|nr:MAG: hypothetical protein A4E49_02026 [Methanosaeta sp. PtaU1.Bin112]
MKAVIDRIEGDLAVVLLGERGEFKFNIRLSYLPEGSKEGDVLKISIERDLTATQETKQRVSSLMGKLKKKGQSGMVKD